MKLNIDCMRDILIFLQDRLNLQFYDDKCCFLGISITDIINDIVHKANVTQEDIWYSVYNLAECGYIQGINIERMNRGRLEDQIIFNITYEGHQFLESIRPETTWKKTKNIVSKVGNHTLKFVEETAQMIAIESAKQAITIAMTNNN